MLKGAFRLKVRLLLTGAAILALFVVSVACGDQQSASPAPPEQRAIQDGAGPTEPPAPGRGAPAPTGAASPSSGTSAIAMAEATAAAATGSLAVGATAASPSPGPTSATSATSPTSPTPATADSGTTTAPSPDLPIPQPSVPAPVEETLIQLIDPLDEPEFYCVDVPGFRDSLRTDRPLQAHTCKPGADDELFLFNQPSAGQVSMPAYDLCMEAEGDQVYTRPCSESAGQIFVYGSDGSLRTGDGEMCLTVAPGEGAPAGGRSHLWRELRLSSCAEVARNLSRWAAPGPDPGSTDGPSTRLMYDALDSALLGDPWEIEKMGASGDAAYIPVLIELMRFPWWRINRAVEVAIFESLDWIVAQNPEIAGVDAEATPDEWLQWIVWMGQHPEVWPPLGFAGWKGALYSELVDPEMGAFLYDGMPANIRIEEIVWGGVAKDGIPDLTDAPVIPGVEAAYLDPEDRVFGVSFNGEHRAYPHRIVNAHEMANDTVGGVSFALAY